VEETPRAELVGYLGGSDAGTTAVGTTAVVAALIEVSASYSITVVKCSPSVTVVQGFFGSGLDSAAAALALDGGVEVEGAGVS
jgi:hypothetical protein